MSSIKSDFNSCIADLMENEDILAMRNIKQHLNTNCLEHSISVARISYSLCRMLGWNAVAAARGGLLHDMFLYNQHQKGRSMVAHLVKHPKVAFENASKISSISDIEKDIILKHMWPLTLKMPKYKEAFVVNLVDTMCAVAEATRSILAAFTARTTIPRMQLLFPKHKKEYHS